MKTILTFITIITTFISPISGLIGLMLLAIIFDTASGIYTSVKLSGWKAIKSTKFFNVFVKCFFMFGALLGGYLVDVYIFDGILLGVTLLISKGITMLGIYNELSSMSENYQRLDPKNKSFLEIVKEFISKMKLIKKDISDLTKGDKEDE